MKPTLLLGLLLLITGSIVANYIQTDGGEIQVDDIRFQDADGRSMSALIYTPKQVTADNPAPGILAIHGYINSRETQSGYAIEFARRGFVVLALDQTGHGYSDSVAFDAGFGGPAGLEYLRSLAIVDATRIGMEGHSMGGWAIQMAAVANPQGYEAMVLQGSSTGTFGTAAGTADYPRNLLLVFSEFDEFSELMWGPKSALDIVSTDKLKTLFGTRGDVLIGKRYGSVAEGNARKLLMPPVTHPGDHISHEAIGAAADWFTETLGAPTPKTNQTWIWKEIGTGIALLGLALLVIPFTSFALHLFSAENTKQLPSGLETDGNQRRMFLAFTMLLPALTFFYFQNLGAVLLPVSSLFPQQITNGVLVWAILNGLISVAWLWFKARGQQFSLTERLRGFAPAFKVAMVVVLAIYILALGISQLLTIDYRFWVVALKPMSATQLGIFFCYLLPFTAFFLMQGMAFHSQVSWKESSERQGLVLNGLVYAGGYAALLALQYIPLFLTGSLLINEPLLSIVAFQFVPIMFFVGALSCFCYARTGKFWLGAMLNGLLVTWYMIAGTATHAIPFWS
jgi:pimeloyl-ACP methyl ester carboxylesterase